MIRKAVRLLATACLIVFTSFNAAAFSADVLLVRSSTMYKILRMYYPLNRKRNLSTYGIQLDDATTAQLAVLILPSIGDEAS